MVFYKKHLVGVIHRIKSFSTLRTIRRCKSRIIRFSRLISTCRFVIYCCTPCWPFYANPDPSNQLPLMQLPLASLFMAGMKGFEPLVMESKSIALTTWLHPYLLYKYYNQKFFENQVLFNFGCDEWNRTTISRVRAGRITFIRRRNM